MASSLAARPGLSGSGLKWIAIAAMLLDHAGVALAAEWYGAAGSLQALDCYYALRTVGRLAFPIFCFLLVEGFFHPGHRGKYALRLGAFCLLSEPFFDLILWRRPIDGQGQNVFFTLLLGLLAMWGSWELSRRYNWHPLPATALTAGLLGLGADWLRTDYGAFGVWLIAALFAGRSLTREGDWRRGLLQLALGALAICWYCLTEHNSREYWAILGLALTLCYNGRRGEGPKWLFYWFYPLHLGALALARGLIFT